MDWRRVGAGYGRQDSKSCISFRGTIEIAHQDTLRILIAYLFSKSSILTKNLRCAEIFLWAVMDSNHRPLRCQRNALTN